MSGENNKAYCIDAADELHVIRRCFSVISSLLIPCDDLHVVNRDDLAMLFGYLTDRMETLSAGQQSMGNISNEGSGI